MISIIVLYLEELTRCRGSIRHYLYRQKQSHSHPCVLHTTFQMTEELWNELLSHAILIMNNNS